MTTLNYLDYAHENTVLENMAATTVCCGATMLAGDSTPIPSVAWKVSASISISSAVGCLWATFVAGEDQPDVTTSSFSAIVCGHHVLIGRGN